MKNIKMYEMSGKELLQMQKALAIYEAQQAPIREKAAAEKAAAEAAEKAAWEAAWEKQQAEDNHNITIFENMAKALRQKESGLLTIGETKARIEKLLKDMI